VDQCRSKSGGIVFLGSGPIWWLSKLQRATALSTTEAEFVASGDLTMGTEPQQPRHTHDLKESTNATDARKQKAELLKRQKQYSKTLAASHSICSVLGLRTILEEVGCKQKTTYVFTDNKGNYESMKNPINTRLRHVNMRYHNIRQSVKAGDIKIAFMGTKSMLADIFTKNFTVAEHQRLRELALGYGQKPDLPEDLRKRLQG